LDEYINLSFLAAFVIFLNMVSRERQKYVAELKESLGKVKGYDIIKVSAGFDT